MHFVTGGAFNGKRSWVKRKYPEAIWKSAYNLDSLTVDVDLFNPSVIIFEGLEEWMKKLSVEIPINEARDYFRNVWKQWLLWEKQASGRVVVFIGTDITKGIVPMEKENREWRDLTGWAYQDLCVQCDRVDVIWYGINKTIKGRN